MRDEEVPIEAPEGGAFDLVVLGTGLVEALVAGAAAKAGKTVLHLDHEDHYGSQWAAFGVPALRQWLAAGDAAVAADAAAPAAPQPGGDEAPVRAVAATRRRYGRVAFAGPDAATDAPPTALRGCSIDLSGVKAAYCVGELVDALLRSGAHAYVEFKAVEASAMLARGALRRVPGSRSDVFTSRDLSAGDKRALMRALKAVADMMPADGGADAALPAAAAASAPALFADGAASFDAALAAAGLSAELRAVVLHALALRDGDVPCAEGVAALQKYLASLGRYSAPGAFLVPLYGAAELPQAFCRTAAVAGALYVLRRDVAALLLEPAASEAGSDAAAQRRVTGVRTASGQALRCGALAAGGAYLDALRPASAAAARRRGVHRVAAVTDAPLHVAGAAAGAEPPAQLMAVLPPGCLPEGAPATPVRLLQFGPSACITPENRFLIHLSTPAADDDTQDAEGALWPALRALVDTEDAATEAAVAAEGDADAPSRPRLRCAVFWTEMLDEPAEEASAWLPPNAALCTGPGAEADVCTAVRAAAATFARLFPGEPFFAPPPSEAAAEPASDDDDADAALLSQVAALDAAATG